ncbi:MAG: hypothetical protein DRR19_19675 [Candidatus Parabeggiatoa sp. nov. 1]|nr:MAG: hypothetical protein DRR19_19675 [Gammaproteobacteria bacterium]
MIYDEIALVCEQLGYRDKLRLAQLLIQQARKEEEEQNPQKRVEKKVDASLRTQETLPSNVDTIAYVAERILKLKPSKRKSLAKSVGAMFQFQGGISDSDKEKIISELQRLNYIDIDSNNRVTYKQQMPNKPKTKRVN